MCEMCMKEPCDPRCPSFHEYRVGTCEKCGIMIMDNEERWEDRDFHLFCSRDCAEEYHEIRKVSL